MNCKCGGQLDAKCPCGGTIICKDNCPVGGGKALKFKFKVGSPIISLLVINKPKLIVTPGNNSIQIHGWTQEPNTLLTGRQWIGELPSTGGTIKVESKYQWISIFAKNPDTSNAYDGACFTSRGKYIDLVSF